MSSKEKGCVLYFWLIFNIDLRMRERTFAGKVEMTTIFLWSYNMMSITPLRQNHPHKEMNNWHGMITKVDTPLHAYKKMQSVLSIKKTIVNYACFLWIIYSMAAGQTATGTQGGLGKLTWIFFIIFTFTSSYCWPTFVFDNGKPRLTYIINKITELGSPVTTTSVS